MKEESCRSFPCVCGMVPHLLILGSMPGVESLRQAQYYAHPRNAFWRIMGTLCDFDPALPYGERLERLKAHGVALWDVLQSCRRAGSSDTGIRSAVPNRIDELLSQNPSIDWIGCNGTASWQYFTRFFPDAGIKYHLQVVRLPSTSPASAALSYAGKAEKWQIFWQNAKKRSICS